MYLLINKWPRIALPTATLALLALIGGPNTGASLLGQTLSPMLSIHAQAGCRSFPETDRTVCGRFLQYWDSNGGLPQQGFPISGEIQETSDTAGKTYTVQYFERAVFEAHPEHHAPYDVLLSLLGVFEYKRQWPGPYYPIQKASDDNPIFFSETGKMVGGAFRAYWEQNGGLRQQGFPITNEFQERSPLNGELYTVQYFQRAVFEFHPENQPPYNVLMSQLGRFRYDARYQAARPSPTARTSAHDCLNFQSLKGTLIAKGTNTIPTTNLKLKTYQVEEVRLLGPVTCKGLIPDKTFNKYWRITVFAVGPFYEGSLIQFMWLDDNRVGSTFGSVDGYRTRVFDFAQLQEGAKLGVGLLDRIFYLQEQLQFNRVP